MKRGEDRQYRLWCLAHMTDPHGSGKFTVGDLAAAIERHKLRGLSRTTLARLLRDGDGLWWRDAGGGTYYRVGIHTVARRLELHRLSAPVELGWQDLRGLQSFRAVAFGAFLSTIRGPIGRRTLHRLVGITPQTQRNYGRLLRHSLGVRPNVANTGHEWQPGDEVTPGFTVHDINGKRMVVRQLPNSYSVSLPRAPRGQCGKFRGDPLAYGGEGQSRHYYASQGAAMRRMQAAQEGDGLYLQTKETTRRGASVWYACQIVGGLALWT